MGSGGFRTSELIVHAGLRGNLWLAPVGALPSQTNAEYHFDSIIFGAVDGHSERGGRVEIGVVG